MTENINYENLIIEEVINSINLSCRDYGLVLPAFFCTGLFYRNDTHSKRDRTLPFKRQDRDVTFHCYSFYDHLRHQNSSLLKIDNKCVHFVLIHSFHVDIDSLKTQQECNCIIHVVMLVTVN